MGRSHRTLRTRVASPAGFCRSPQRFRHRVGQLGEISRSPGAIPTGPRPGHDSRQRHPCRNHPYPAQVRFLGITPTRDTVTVLSTGLGFAMLQRALHNAVRTFAVEIDLDVARILAARF